MRIYYIVVLVAVASVACDDTGCGNNVITRSPSSSQRVEAVVFDRDCGATTDYSRQVSIVDSGKAPRGIGNVFVAAHRTAVVVRWIGSDSLEVSYSADEKPLKLRQARGVAVVFHPVAGLSDQASKSGLSNDR